MLGFGETRAFHEVENADRLVFKLRTGFARGRQIGAFFLGVFGQVRLGVTFHERETQRPPRQTNYRHPDQLLLEEELQRADAFIEHVLQHHDVDPALVVAGHQVRMLVIEPLQSLDLPAGLPQQVHPAFVIADPRFVDMAHQPVGAALGGCKGQAQFENGHHEQRRAAHDGVDRQQQGSNHAA